MKMKLMILTALASLQFFSELEASDRHGCAWIANLNRNIQKTAPTGPTGPTGPNGLQGLQGERGNTGPCGSKGEPGLHGVMGPTGPSGLQGLQGERGNTGPCGSKGEPGLDGIMGPTGPTGPRGLDGEPGSSGPTGKQGPEGNRGDTGPTGPKGAAVIINQSEYASIFNTETKSISTDNYIPLNEIFSESTGIYQNNGGLQVSDDGIYSISYGYCNSLSDLGRVGLSIVDGSGTKILKEVTAIQGNNNLLVSATVIIKLNMDETVVLYNYANTIELPSLESCMNAFLSMHRLSDIP